VDGVSWVVPIAFFLGMLLGAALLFLVAVTYNTVDGEADSYQSRRPR
jgi:hypothetical protein